MNVKSLQDFSMDTFSQSLVAFADNLDKNEAK